MNGAETEKKMRGDGRSDQKRREKNPEEKGMHIGGE
jgi:hypothetical protein